MTAFWTVVFVHGWVVRFLKFMRMTANDLLTAAAVAYPSPDVPDTVPLSSSAAHAPASPLAGMLRTFRPRPGFEPATWSDFPIRLPVTSTLAPPRPSGPPSANSRGTTPVLVRRS